MNKRQIQLLGDLIAIFQYLGLTANRYMGSTLRAVVNGLVKALNSAYIDLTQPQNEDLPNE